MYWKITGEEIQVIHMIWAKNIIMYYEYTYKYFEFV